jgi:hypothetical protein
MENRTYILEKMLMKVPTKEDTNFCGKRFRPHAWGSDRGFFATVTKMLTVLQENGISPRVTPLGVDTRYCEHPIVMFHYKSRKEADGAETLLKHIEDIRLGAWRNTDFYRPYLTMTPDGPKEILV